MTPGYLFDSHALLAFFQDEEGAEIIAEILRRSAKQHLDQLICVINVGEIIYLTKRRFGDNKKMEILGRIHQLGFNILPVPESLVYEAAELKAEYSISYADCFALACALEHSAILVTGDPEFKKVVHLVNIEWIR
jgi:predicted nucleic acid-binding protein